MSYFSTTFEDCRQFSISDLKRLGCLRRDYLFSGNLNFYRGDRKVASIGIEVNTKDSQPYLELNYSINEEKAHYHIKLQKVPTNIGNSFRYYFVCPATQTRCMKLYRPPQGLYFLGRNAFPDMLYRKQTQSRTYRALDKSLFAKVMGLEEMQESLFAPSKKYQKLCYRGRPTKRFKKYLDLEAEVDKLYSAELKR